ncbi:MAG: hypothetical protein ACYCWW_13380 [Deltaproteobacteria bacterium]
MRPSLVLALASVIVAATACPGASSNGGGTTGGATSGSSGGGDGGAQIVSLTTDPSEAQALSLAVGPSDQLGIAYFQSLDAGVGGDQSYEVRYLAWTNGQLAGPETVATVQRTLGLSIAFDGAGNPSIAYLGGHPYGGPSDGGNVSNYWLQSEAVVAYRQPGGGWTEQVATPSDDDPVTPNNPYQATGEVVLGLWPALGFAGETAYSVFRDVHFAQFPRDWEDSDMKSANGGPTSWTQEVALVGGSASNEFQGIGTHNALAMANGQPAVVCDEASTGPAQNGGAQNVDFVMRSDGGSWTPPQRILTIHDTQTGPSIAWDPQGGFAVAAVDADPAVNALQLVTSPDGASWSAPFPIYQSGTGGWYPSIAFNPQTHEPAVAFYLCSLESGVPQGSCPKSGQQLDVMVKNGARWQQEEIDPAGGYLPRLGFLSTGEMVIAYRSLEDGHLLLATQP